MAVVAIGVIAATLAAICHETLGHGLACIGSSGHITLLTSIWFRCSRWNVLTIAAGPLANLLAGTLALALLSRIRPAPRMQLFLMLFGALNVLWFTSQLAFNAFRDLDDWHYLALQMGWPTTTWRVIGTIAGVVGYVLVTRWLATIIRRRGLPHAAPLRLAYAGAAVSAAIAGLMWHPEPFRSALEGFLTLGVAPLGLLYVARDAPSRSARTEDVEPLAGIWIASGAVLYAAFLLIQAQGLGPLAALSPLS